MKAELPLFITDPADGRRKMVGTKQVLDDDSVVWFRRLASDNVMREGSFGLDATTFDTQFVGHEGIVRIEVGLKRYEVDIVSFIASKTERDLGHGRQYFLPFARWTASDIKAEVSPLRSTIEQDHEDGDHSGCDHPPRGVLVPTKTSGKLEFGIHRLCSACKGKGLVEGHVCGQCLTKGYVSG